VALLGIIRNFINIEGITPEENLEKNDNGHMIIYSDIEYISIPNSEQEIKNIYEISIDIDVISQRLISTPIGKIMVLDGIKKFKILFTKNTDSQNASILDLDIPFNAFTELPKGNYCTSNIKVHIIDAYFNLLDRKTIYGHFIYLIDVIYNRNYNNSSPLSNLPMNKEKKILSHELYVNNRLDEISISEEHYESRPSNSLIDIDEEIL
jgi:hypothetical protein